MDSLLYKKIKEFGHLKSNVSLSKFSTFKIGGVAEFFIEVTQTNKLVDLLNFITAEGVDYAVLGGGSNVLFPDGVCEKLIIKIKTDGLEKVGKTIISDAGVSYGLMMNFAIKNSLVGLEWSAGLPGTVGGAIRGNAGAAGGDTSKVLSKAEVWVDGEVLEFKNKDCEFDYRESVFKHNGGIILRGFFELDEGDKKNSLLKIQEILKKRVGFYPPFPSAGSFFKNIPSDKFKEDVEIPEEFKKKAMIPAGWLIDKAGLKGLSRGGAMVSKEHGNFLINYSGATQSDVLGLVEEVKSSVYNKFKVQLFEEVQVIK